MFLEALLRRSINPKIQQYSQTLYFQHRHLTRFTEKSPGSGRQNRLPRNVRRADRRVPRLAQRTVESNLEAEPSTNESSLWNISSSRVAQNPTESLNYLLSNETLVVTRQLEMLNIFIGYEQNNKYAIMNSDGETLGYIVEEQGSIANTISRQILRTHRPFRALILDLQGSTILWLRRPFTWINSKMYIQKLKDENDPNSDGNHVMDTFAEIQQRWHFWRRRYDLFLRESPRRILSEIDKPQPEPGADLFRQFAKTDEGLWAWNFDIYDAKGEVIANIKRAFRGFGREIFTDTGQYFVQFSRSADAGVNLPQFSSTVRKLSLEEKALILAMSVNIDFDYFSRHSSGTHTFLPFWWGGDE